MPPVATFVERKSANTKWFLSAYIACMSKCLCAHTYHECISDVKIVTTKIYRIWKCDKASSAKVRKEIEKTTYIYMLLLKKIIAAEAAARKRKTVRRTNIYEYVRNVVSILFLIFSFVLLKVCFSFLSFFLSHSTLLSPNFGFLSIQLVLSL